MTAEPHEPEEKHDEQTDSQRREGVMASFGVFPSPPGVETGDFDDLIEEAMLDHADEVVRRMQAGLE